MSLWSPDNNLEDITYRCVFQIGHLIKKNRGPRQVTCIWYLIDFFIKIFLIIYFYFVLESFVCILCMTILGKVIGGCRFLVTYKKFWATMCVVGESNLGPLLRTASILNPWIISLSTNPKAFKLSHAYFFFSYPIFSWKYPNLSIILKNFLSSKLSVISILGLKSVWFSVMTSVIFSILL